MIALYPTFLVDRLQVITPDTPTYFRGNPNRKNYNFERHRYNSIMFEDVTPVFLYNIDSCHRWGGVLYTQWHFYDFTTCLKVV